MIRYDFFLDFISMLHLRNELKAQTALKQLRAGYSWYFIRYICREEAAAGAAGGHELERGGALLPEDMHALSDGRLHRVLRLRVARKCGCIQGRRENG